MCLGRAGGPYLSAQLRIPMAEAPQSSPMIMTALPLPQVMPPQ
jgi:hypothetical protein